MYECAFIPTRSSPPDRAAPAGRAAALDVTKSRDVTEQLSVLAPFQVLVNSAGMNRPKELVDVPDEDIDAILDLNVKRRST
jgi:NADP-dependent 3-hydroxy acid dehydrogenase YdfG